MVPIHPDAPMTSDKPSPATGPDPRAELAAVATGSVAGSPEGSDEAFRLLEDRVNRNVAWNFTGQFWTFGITFLATPFIARGLGTGGYGVLVTLGVVTNYVWFMDLGLGQATVKYVAEHAGQHEWEEVARVFWTSLLGFLLMGGIAAGIMLIIAPLCVREWFRIPVELQPDALLAFRLSAASLFLGMLNFGASSTLRGLQRFDIVNKVNMLVGTAQPFLTVGLLWLGFTLPAVVLGTTVITAAALVVNLVCVQRLLPLLGGPVWSSTVFRRLVRFGGYLAGSTLLVPILVNLEKLILANRLSIAAVAYYMVPHNFTSRLGIIPSAYASALYPAFSSLHGSGQGERTAELNEQATRSIFLLFYPVALFLLVFGTQFLELWMGEEFAVEGAVALQILVLATFINAFAWTPHFLLQASGRPDITLWLYTAELAVTVPTTILAIGAWGIEGAAIAWLVRVTLDTVLAWWAVSRVVGVPTPLRGLLGDWRVPTMLLGAVLLWFGKGLFQGHIGVVTALATVLGTTLAFGAGLRPTVNLLRKQFPRLRAGG